MIRLSHYEQILRGELDTESEDSNSYAGHWQQMRSLLKDHVAAFAAMSAASTDAASALQMHDGIVGSAADRLDSSSRLAANGGLSLKTPLPLFKGLQDGFDRL